MTFLKLQWYPQSLSSWRGIIIPGKQLAMGCAWCQILQSVTPNLMLTTWQPCKSERDHYDHIHLSREGAWSHVMSPINKIGQLWHDYRGEQERLIAVHSENKSPNPCLYRKYSCEKVKSPMSIARYIFLPPPPPSRKLYQCSLLHYHTIFSQYSWLTSFFS